MLQEDLEYGPGNYPSSKFQVLYGKNKTREERAALTSRCVPMRTTAAAAMPGLRHRLGDDLGLVIPTCALQVQPEDVCAWDRETNQRLCAEIAGWNLSVAERTVAAQRCLSATVRSPEAAFRGTPGRHPRTLCRLLQEPATPVRVLQRIVQGLLRLNLQWFGRVSGFAFVRRCLYTVCSSENGTRNSAPLLLASIKRRRSRNKPAPCANLTPQQPPK